jgi:serine/threonine protein kinase
MANIQRRLMELTAEQQARLEQIVESFEAAWRQGSKPAIERFLPPEKGFRTLVLAELVHLDAALHQAAGDKTRLDDYFDRFPELSEDKETARSLLAFAKERASRRVKSHAQVQRTDKPVAADDDIPALKQDTQEQSRPEHAPDTDISLQSGPSGSPEAGNDLAPGTVLGNYVIIRKLGEGGMGAVYLAEHSRMRRFVALKVLSPRVVNRPDAIRRFRREVQAVAKLSHENIVTAHDADEINGLQILVMEYVEGTNLSSLVRNKGPLPIRKAVDYIMQAARGLQYAHSKGIVHRDIKPGNLMLAENGTVKVLDLGLARFDETVAEREQTDLTETGNLMGTIDYLAPEQAADSSAADQRSDVYSLGCTLFHLLTGKPMFAGRSVMERLLAHRERKPPSLRDERNDVSMELDAVYRKMVAKEPIERFPTMSAVLHAFARSEYERSGSSDVAGIVAPVTEGYRIAGQSDDPEPSSVGVPFQTPAALPAPSRRELPKIEPGTPLTPPSKKQPRHAAKSLRGKPAPAAKKQSDTDYDPAGIDIGRWMIIGSFALLILAAAAGAWWFFSDNTANSPPPAESPTTSKP